MASTLLQNRIAAEEIKLSRNLRNLSNLLTGFETSNRPKYLLESISNLECRLKSLRDGRAL